MFIKNTCKFENYSYLCKRKNKNRSLTIWLASSVGRARDFHISKSALNENLSVELP